MKHVFLILTALCLCTVTFAQDIKTNPLADKIKMKISLSKDIMQVTYKNQPVPINSIQALDSLIKKIENPKDLEVEFESINGTQEKTRSINSVLKQYKCHVVKRSVQVWRD